MSVLAIIDADSLIWTTAYNMREKDPEDPMDTLEAQSILTQAVHDILNEIKATAFIGFMGGSKCFRHTIWTNRPYKGSRPAAPVFMELWEKPLKEYANQSLNFHYCNGIEADDAVSICIGVFKNAILCGIDKDLKQIPGKHFNYQKDKWFSFTVSEEEALYNLYSQMVIGDKSDDITGIEGLGEKKFPGLFQTIVNGVPTLMPGYKMRYAVLHLYIQKYGEYEGTKRYYSSYRLLKMLTPDQAVEHGFTIPTLGMFKDYVPNESKTVVENLKEEAASEAARLLSPLV